MTLGVILAVGESLGDFQSKGQLKRLLNYNIKKYCQAFEKVYIFSYANEKGRYLPKNCELVPNNLKLHRYLYSLLMPFIKRKEIKDCTIIRGLQLTGGIPASVAKLFFSKRFIINYGYDYASFAEIEGKLFQSLLYKLIKNPVIKLADSVIVTSKEIKKGLLVEIDKIAYIPNGVDANLFHPRISSKFKRYLKVIYLGRLEKQKNLDNLIKAASMISIPIKIVFYGSGSLLKNLKKLAKRLSVNLEIRAPVEYQKVPDVLSSADIFILPSVEEGNPKILLEAMSSGLAVIGTNVRGIKELIANNQTGILTAIDAKSIAESIVKLQYASLRKKLGENARQYVIKNYDINKLLDQEVNLLKKMAIKNDK